MLEGKATVAKSAVGVIVSANMQVQLVRNHFPFQRICVYLLNASVATELLFDYYLIYVLLFHLPFRRCKLKIFMMAKSISPKQLKACFQSLSRD